MSSQSNDATVVLASGNRGKLREFQQRLNDTGWVLHPQSEFAVPEAEENGLSFVENAIIKARNASAHSGHAALADDSGLCVDALDGRPGIYSARFAGDNANDADNNALLLRELANVDEPQRGAQFVCALVYVRHAEDPRPVIAQGVWHGRILREPRGDNGFGYDPLFLVPERNCSSAELPPEIKNQISHRGLAINQLLQQLQDEL